MSAARIEPGSLECKERTKPLCYGLMPSCTVFRTPDIKTNSISGHPKSPDIEAVQISSVRISDDYYCMLQYPDIFCPDIEFDLISGVRIGESLFLMLQYMDIWKLEYDCSLSHS